LLRKAWQRHPGDFWVNHELAVALDRLQPPPHDEALRHHALAVSANPRSAGAWFNYGSELTQQFVRAQTARKPPERSGFRWMGELDILDELDPVVDNLRVSDAGIAALERALAL